MLFRSLMLTVCMVGLFTLSNCHKSSGSAAPQDGGAGSNRDTSTTGSADADGDAHGDGDAGAPSTDDDGGQNNETDGQIEVDTGTEIEMEETETTPTCGQTPWLRVYPPLTEQDIIDIAVLAADNVYAAVNDGPAMKFDGSSWTRLDLTGWTPLQFVPFSASDIFVLALSTANHSQLEPGTTGILHFDGTTWRDLGYRGLKDGFTYHRHLWIDPARTKMAIWEWDSYEATVQHTREDGTWTEPESLPNNVVGGGSVGGCDLSTVHGFAALAPGSSLGVIDLDCSSMFGDSTTTQVALACNGTSCVGLKPQPPVFAASSPKDVAVHGTSDAFLLDELGVVHFQGTSVSRLEGLGANSYTRLEALDADIFALAGGGFDRYEMPVGVYANNELLTWSLPHRGIVRDVSGTLQNDLFVVGNHGLLVQATDGAYRSHNGPVNEPIATLFALSETKILVATSQGTLLERDDTTWNPLARFGPMYAQDMWALAPNDVYIGGSRDGLPALVHYDGSAAHNLDFTSLTPPFIYARDIWISDDGTIYVVAQPRTTDGKATIFVSEGDGWRIHAPDAPEQVWGIWGAGNNQLYATVEAGKIFGYDGISWTELFDGNPPNGNTRYKSIWGRGPNQIYAWDSNKLVEYDGNEWRKIDVSAVLSSVDDIYAPSTEELYLVGDDVDSYNNVVARYDGQSLQELWHVEGQSALRITGTGPDAIYTLVKTIQPDGEYLVLRYNGINWIPNPIGPELLDDGTTERHLSDIEIGPADEIFVAGTAGAFLTYTGSNWTSVDVGFSLEDNFELGRTGNGAIFALFYDSVILEQNGDTWQTRCIDACDSISRLWPSASPNGIVAACWDGALMEFAGGELVHSSRPLASFSGTWLVESTRYVADGDNTLFELAGYGAVPTGLVAPDRITAVWGCDSSSVYALEQQGQLHHHDGQTWSEDANLGFEASYVGNLACNTILLRDRLTNRLIRLNGDSATEFAEIDDHLEVGKIEVFDADSIYLTTRNGIHSNSCP